MRRRDFLATTAAALVAPALRATRAAAGRRVLLYIAEPGIRNYITYGGVGVLVYDVTNGFAFVKRIPTWSAPRGEDIENVKGIAASAHTGRLYVSTLKRLGCIDLATDAMLWSRAFEAGCDRMAIAPDGRTLYVPSFEGPRWYVVDAMTGDTITTIETNSGSHNTIYGPDGVHVYLAGLKSTSLSIADASTRKVVNTVGPFENVIRPFTVNGAETLCYVNVNDLLGFEIGDIRTGKKLHHIVVHGFAKGPVDRHGCPSHGIGLTPDEREVWLCDGHNRQLHVFDNTVMPPKQVKSIPVRDQPGWITFSMDGARAYPSTGEVFDVRTKRKIAVLADEMGRPVGSEKLVEIAFEDGTPVAAGDQFGIGGRR